MPCPGLTPFVSIIVAHRCGGARRPRRRRQQRHLRIKNSSFLFSRPTPNPHPHPRLLLLLLPSQHPLNSNPGLLFQGAYFLKRDFTLQSGKFTRTSESWIAINLFFPYFSAPGFSFYLSPRLAQAASLPPFEPLIYLTCQSTEIITPSLQQAAYEAVNANFFPRFTRYRLSFFLSFFRPHPAVSGSFYFLGACVYI